MTDDFPVDVLRKMCNLLSIGNKSTEQIIWNQNPVIYLLQWLQLSSLLKIDPLKSHDFIYALERDAKDM